MKIKLHFGECPSSKTEVALRAKLEALSLAVDVINRDFHPSAARQSLSYEMKLVEIKLEEIRK